MKAKTWAIPLIFSVIVGSTYTLGLNQGANGERERQAKNFETISNDYRKKLLNRELNFKFQDSVLHHKTYDSKSELIEDTMNRNLSYYMDLSAEVIFGKRIDANLKNDLRRKEWQISRDYESFFSSRFIEDYQELQKQGCPIQ